MTKQQLVDALNKSFKNNSLYLWEIAGYDWIDFRQSFKTYIVPDKAISEPGAVTTDAVKKDTSDTATKSFEDQIKEILKEQIEFQTGIVQKEIHKETGSERKRISPVCFDTIAE